MQKKVERVLTSTRWFASGNPEASCGPRILVMSEALLHGHGSAKHRDRSQRVAEAPCQPLCNSQVRQAGTPVATLMSELQTSCIARNGRGAAGSYKTVVTIFDHLGLQPCAKPRAKLDERLSREAWASHFQFHNARATSSPSRRSFALSRQNGNTLHSPNGRHDEIHHRAFPVRNFG